MSAATRRIAMPLAVLLLLAADAASRGGQGGRVPLAVGDVGFVVKLDAADGKSSFDASETDGKPVAFVFGSYT